MCVLQVGGCGCAKTKSAALAGFHRPAEAVGGGEDVLVARSEPQAELRDYEKLTATSEAFVYVAMMRLMARRLAHS